MKQLSLLLLLCFFSAAGLRAATVSGTITNSSTSAAVVGQKVYIVDTLTFPMYLDSTLTNSSGAYSFTLPASVTSGHPLLVYGYGCGAYFGAVRFYSGSSISGWNFSICGSPATTYTLQGQIVLPGSSSTHRSAMVYLIRRQYDSVLVDTTLTAIDSIAVSGVGGAFSKSYSAVPSGTLLLKVALLPADTEYANYLPTYWDSSLQWNGARPLLASSFGPSVYTHYLYMVAGSNLGGPGFIGGSVLAGANKTTAAGDPLAKRILILTKSNGVAVRYTYSNASGQFSFSNLPVGTYKIFGDVWGKKNPALTVNITSTSSSVSNILFKENRKDFTGQIGGLNVGGVSPLAGVTAYPNPAMDYIEVGGLAAISGSKTVTLQAVNGALITHQDVAAGQSLRLSTATLAPGVYILRVQTAEGSVQMKVTK